MSDERTKTNKIQNNEQTEVWKRPEKEAGNNTSNLNGSSNISFLGKSLGEILSQTTKLSPEQLAEALSQGSNEDALADFLVKKKWITPEQLMQARSLQLSIPLVKKEALDDLDGQLITDIPINFAKKFNLVPIDKTAFAYKVAFFSPQSISALDDLKLLLQADVTPVLAWKEDIISAINQIYNQATRTDNNLNQDLIEDLEAQDLAQINLNDCLLYTSDAADE